MIHVAPNLRQHIGLTRILAPALPRLVYRRKKGKNTCFDVFQILVEEKFPAICRKLFRFGYHDLNKVAVVFFLLQILLTTISN